MGNEFSTWTKRIIHYPYYPRICYPLKRTCEHIQIVDRYIHPVQEPQNFYFYGTLYNKEKNLVVQLYARERHRNVWDYYIVFNGNNFTTSKIYLEKFHENINYKDSLYLDVFDETFTIYRKNIEHIYESYF